MHFHDKKVFHGQNVDNVDNLLPFSQGRMGKTRKNSGENAKLSTLSTDGMWITAESGLLCVLHKHAIKHHKTGKNRMLRTPFFCRQTDRNRKK